MIKNDLLIKALKGEEVQRPPVWMMRQAGRYLPEFIELRNQYDFFTRCQTPELATEITLQPLRRFPLDAAILFSDILVVPQAMGLDFQMKPGFGPYLEDPIRNTYNAKKVIVPNVEESLGYVFDAVKLTKKELNNKVPLIGFAGSPWTILCYAVEGKGSKTFDLAKGFCFENEMAAHELLEKITETTIHYLTKKVESGCDVIQLFDSWGGLLSPTDYDQFSWKYIETIVNKISELVPVIVFAKGCWFALEKMSQSKAAALGVDWTINPQMARDLTRYKKTLQGNFDPARLLSPPETISKMVHDMIDDFGAYKYIANLGHGILPNIPLENVSAFVNSVVNYKKV